MILLSQGGNRFHRKLDFYIKVLFKCNEVVCHSMVVQIKDFSTKMVTALYTVDDTSEKIK